MLSTGNISPERNTAGIMSSMPEMSRATICFSTSEDISIPNERETKIKSRERAVRSTRLPAIGTLSTNTESSRIVM